MGSVKKQYHQVGRDDAANRVYQAFERLQFAWYIVNTRRPANGEPRHDDAAILELNAAEEEWLAVRESTSSGF
jgi:hypothetical protein